MNTTFRAALIWGFVCFILLYRTLLAEIVLSWQVLQQFDVPVWQLLVSYSAGILPALIPLGCFGWLSYKTNHSKLFAMTLPFAAWLLGSVLLLAFFLFITLKISDVPPYSGGFGHLFSQQMVRLFGSVNTLTCAIIIVACSYAFWRERRNA